MGEKEDLLACYQQAREARRSHAILLIKSGRSIQEVAEICYVDEETVKNWLKKWRLDKNIKDAPLRGAPKKITKEVEKEIVKLVEKNDPQREGLQASSWDCHELRLWLEEKHRIEVSEERLRKILKQNGFNWRKVNYQFTQADEEKRKDFLEDFQEFHDDIVEESTIIFQDEMSSKLHPHQGRIWTREARPVMLTDCSHEKTYVIGGVAPSLGRTYTLTNEKFNSGVFIQFLRLLLRRNQGDLTLVLDNHPSHHSKRVRQFLDINPRLNLLFLPAYSPDLNPQENLWRHLRKKLLNNKLFKSVKDMAKALKQFLRKLPKKVVKSVCSYDYLLERET